MPLIAAIDRPFLPCWAIAQQPVVGAAGSDIERARMVPDSAMRQHKSADEAHHNRDHQSRKSLPVNSHGGYKAKRHPQGAFGMGQCVELFQQLRDAVDQDGRARIALAHNIDGPTDASAVTSSEGPGTYGS